MKIFKTNSIENTRMKALIFGESGNGKTSQAMTLPAEKTLIISSEAGLLCLKDHQPSIDVIDITVDDEGNPIPKEKRYARLGEVYKYVLGQQVMAQYDWLFVDSLTEISQNLIEALYLEFPERKDSLPMYAENAKRMRSLIKVFRDIPHYNVVFTALASIEKDENNKRYKGIQMVGSIGQTLPSYFDEVFYLSAIENSETKEIKRSFLTAKTEDCVSKDRSGKLAKYEPANLGLIYKKIMGA